MTINVVADRRLVELPDGGGTFLISRDGNEVVVQREGGGELTRFLIDSVTSLTIEGSDQDDTVIVDWSGGDPSPAEGIAFNGNGEGANGDSLELTGGAAANVDHTFDNDSDGQVEVDGSIISYTGLEPIADHLDATNRVFSFANTSDDVTLEDDGAESNGMSRIRSLSSSETVVFANPASRLRIDAGGGHDVVTVAAVDSGFAALVAVFGGRGGDRIDASGVGFGVLLNGGFDNDTLIGSSGGDFLFGGAGRDRLDGGDGDDVVDGQGASLDTVTGGAGADRLRGGPGTDLLDEFRDADLILTDAQLTGPDTDTVSNFELARLAGGAGANRLDAGGFSGRVTLVGAGGNDTLVGGSQNDFLNGNSGNDILDGRGGDDHALGGSGRDSLDGSAGNDFLDGQGGLDSLQGGADDDLLFGGTSNDTVDGGAGDDTLFGEQANDSLSGGTGNDLLNGGAGRDIMRAGIGDDTLLGGAGHDTILGQDGADVIFGQGLDDAISGGAGADLLNGNAGDDTILGDGGGDFIFGGSGQDIGLGGDGDDIVKGQGGSGDTLAGQAGEDRVVGSDVEIDELFDFDFDVFIDQL